MQTINNVISALRCCVGLDGHPHCKSCPYDSVDQNKGFSCDQLMAMDAIEYLEDHRRDLGIV